MKDSEEFSNNQDILHIYKSVFHGFSTLTTQQAQQLKTQPGILAVIPDQLRQIHTTRSPIFLGLEGKNPSGLITESDSGSDVIIGIFDTGIWPERLSFHDKGLPPIPARWKGECVEGENFGKNHCNKKLIGARYFRAAYEASMRMKEVNISSELKSPRDTQGHGKDLPYTPIIYAGHAFIRQKGFSNFSGGACMPKSLDSNLVRGKIVICNRGGTSRAMKGETVKSAGGVGVIVANLAATGEGLVADAHIIPGLSVTASVGDKLRSYVKLNQNPRASIVFHGTQVGVKPAPVVASFSARGPNAESIYVLKPDIIAPGVNILAAWPDNTPPTELAMDTRRTDFNILSGTSMSCPHVSGLVALLKGAHPDWSPAMVKSAFMTTAYTMDSDGKPIEDEKAYNESKVWDMGAGHVDPDKAIDPGLVYDLTSTDYLNFLCSSNYSRQEIRLIARRSLGCKGTKQKPWDLNYPAIVVAFEESETSTFEVVVRRTVTHVSENASTYIAEVINPKHVNVTVDPPRMKFTKKGEKQSYIVRISGKKMGVSAGSMLSEEGKLTWRDGDHVVNTPLVVVYQKPLF
ncbi:hypothetical protein AG4045_029617 [Apium graveolens]|uniref:Uncharacterized protein n=1 Tax=Apium graveolens TaxID=4045 RepID=A0A6L5B7I9_APIGR|nr:hypothetical protein AG4045_029617 [Apium graveolens]